MWMGFHFEKGNFGGGGVRMRGKRNENMAMFSLRKETFLLNFGLRKEWGLEYAYFVVGLNDLSLSLYCPVLNCT